MPGILLTGPNDLTVRYADGAWSAPERTDLEAFLQRHFAPSFFKDFLGYSPTPANDMAVAVASILGLQVVSLEEVESLPDKVY